MTEPATLSITPETPKQPSRKELGQMRRRYVTIQHSTVVACGHPYDIARQPSTNCFWCWQAFFRTNLEETHKALQTYGSEGMTKVYGEKFVKMFKRFLADELLPDAPVDITSPTPYTEVVEESINGTTVATQRDVNNSGVSDLPNSQG